MIPLNYHIHFYGCNHFEGNPKKKKKIITFFSYINPGIIIYISFKRKTLIFNKSAEKIIQCYLFDEYRTKQYCELFFHSIPCIARFFYWTSDNFKMKFTEHFRNFITHTSNSFHFFQIDGWSLNISHLLFFGSSCYWYFINYLKKTSECKTWYLEMCYFFLLYFITEGIGWLLWRLIVFFDSAKS